MAKHPTSGINGTPTPARDKPEIGKVNVSSAAGIAHEIESSDVQRRMIAIWERLFSPRAVDPTKNFFELGGDSVLAVRLFARIDEEFQCKLTPAALPGAPTIDQLVQVIVARSSIPFKSVVPVQTLGERTPLFFIHGSGGEPTGAWELSRWLGSDQPVYGMRSRGLCGDPVQDSIPEIAEYYVECIRRVQPKGPYCLSGFCFGGLVAYEMARLLTSQNENVPVLALFDTPVPGSIRTLRTLDRVRKRVRHEFWRLRRGKVPSSFSLLADKTRHGIRVASRKLKAAVWGIAKMTLDGNGKDLEQVKEDVSDANIVATKTYFPGAYAGPIALFLASEALVIYGNDLYERWLAFGTGGIELHCSDGEHQRQLEDPFVKPLAEKLKEIMLRSNIPLRPDRSSRTPAVPAAKAIPSKLELPSSPLSDLLT